VEVVASLSQGRTAAAQCGLFTYKSVPVIFEPPCRSKMSGVGDSSSTEQHRFTRVVTSSHFHARISI